MARKEKRFVVHTESMGLGQAKVLMDRITGENRFSIRCDSRDVKEGSWQSLCKEFFKEAKRRISKRRI